MKLKIMMGALLCILTLNQISFTSQQTRHLERSATKIEANTNNRHDIVSKILLFFRKRPSEIHNNHEAILIHSDQNSKDGQPFQNKPIEKERNIEDSEDFELLCKKDQETALILEAAEINEFRLLRMFIKDGWDVECTNKEGCTPLMIAVRHGSYESARVLLEAKVAIDTRNIYGRTALHEACKAGQLDCIRLLREYGASKEALDKKGYRPSQSALSLPNGDLKFASHKSLRTKPIGKYDAKKKKWTDEAQL